MGKWKEMKINFLLLLHSEKSCWQSDSLPVQLALPVAYGFTIVMVTHNANIAEMANTVIRMNSGEIAEIYVNTVQKSAYEIGW